MSLKDKVKRFALYTGASTIAMVIDLFLFILLAEIILRNIDPNTSIMVATIVSRLVSSTINFNLSKRAFKTKDLRRSAFFKFFAVIGIQLLTSAILVMMIYHFVPLPKTVVKCIVDTTLYFVFYKVHSKYVFLPKRYMLLENN